MEKLLQVQKLTTCFETLRGSANVVDGVDFSIDYGETLGIVGESGCGKSITSLSIMRLIPANNGRITGGSILWKGKNLLGLPENQMRDIRGNEISMIFQEPMTSLNPVFTVGSQIAEVLTIHQNLRGRQAKERTIEMLRLVGIPSPEKRAKEYPHQLSGGMRQRVMIAIALACAPQLLIADEPTTALDVTIQAQIIELMLELKEKFNTAIILISHDMGVVAEMAQNVMIMYAGKVMEYADVRSIYKNPLHPYTVGLLHSIPKVSGGQERLGTIEGVVPNLYSLPGGCRFHPRCGKARAVCREKEPPVFAREAHQVRCWQYGEAWGGIADA